MSFGGALTQDCILGGRVQILQPRDGFRAGIDAVLLAASVPAKPGDTALELGCGVGSASLCLAARVPDISIVGVEIQRSYADLAKQNAEAFGSQLKVVECDLASLTTDLRQQTFDQVFANPPYYLPTTREAASDEGRELALAERTPLETWVQTAARRLVPGGAFTMIQTAERLPDMLAAVQANRFGAIEVLPLIPRKGRPARFVILRARKGRKTPFRLHSSVVLHDGAAHVSDTDGFSSEITRVLTEPVPLNFGVS